MNRQKLFLCAFRIGGALSLAVLLIVKNPYGMERFCAGSMDYGDLYRECKVRDFRIRLPASQGRDLGPVDSSAAGSYRLFIMGDSFMADRRGHDSLADLLSRELDEPAFREGWDIRNPVCIFRRLGHGVDKSSRRIVILETVERAIVSRLSRPMDCDAFAPKPVARRSPLTQARKFFSLLFRDDEKRLRFFFHNNVVTAPIVERWNSAMFSLFGIISDVTPTYSLHPPFLFIYEETRPDLKSSFYYPHTDKLIDAIADNLATMSRTLRADYGAELVFMPVPNSYTIYHRFVHDDPYDDFLPRLCAAAEKRGVKTVRLYERFMGAAAPVYFPTDTHWNARGVEIALDAIKEALGGSPKADFSRVR